MVYCAYRLCGRRFILDEQVWTIQALKWGFIRILILCISESGEFRVLGRLALRNARFLE